MQNFSQYPTLLCAGVLAFMMVWLASVAFAAPSFQVPAGERQLFLDNVGIAKVENLERTMHQPAKKGAVIRPDWHKGESNAIIRTAPVFDPKDNLFKLWMTDGSCRQSADGLHWARLPQKGVKVGKVVYDASDPDPSRRYKAFLPNRGFAVSLDGVTWKMLPGAKVSSSDESNFSFDEKAHLFIATVKRGGPYGRSVHLETSEDFKTWTNHGLMFHTDAEDQKRGKENIKARLADPTLQPMYYTPNPAVWNVDVYNMGVFRYECLYVGMPALYHAVGKEPRYPNTEGFQLVQLTCSRDLKKWERLGDRKPFIGPSRMGSGAYELTQIMPPSAPVVRGDELWFYYWAGKYRGGWKWVGPDGDWTTRNGSWTDGTWVTCDDFHPDPDISAVCLAVLRRDGFVSLDAGETEGTIVTKPFKLPGSKLFVNVDAPSGQLRVEALDRNGKVLAASTSMAGDLLRAEVKWQKGDLARLKGKAISLRFTLRNASLYSYWVE